MPVSPEKLVKAMTMAEARSTEAAELLVRLLAVDTVSPPGNTFATLVDILEPEYGALGMETERVVVPEEIIRSLPYPFEGPRVNLVARMPGSQPPVSIYAHMDTVPYNRAEWGHNPLGEIADGRIYGRGASDMKSAIAGLIAALRIARDLNLPLAYKVHALMCTDEEVRAGYAGVKYLAETGRVVPPILSMEGRSDARIETGYVGALALRLTVIGRSVHSGRAYLGVNAVESIVPIMQELLELKEIVEQRESKHRAEPDAPHRFRHPVFNLNIIRGGIGDNIIPDRCSLVIDRRYLPEERLEDVEAEIEAAVERGKRRSKALDVEMEWVRGYPPMTVDMESMHVKRMLEARCLAQGYELEDFIAYISYGSSDMAEVQKVLGTDQFVIAGLGGKPENRGHGVDENVSIQELSDFVKVLLCFLTDNALLAHLAPQ